MSILNYALRCSWGRCGQVRLSAQCLSQLSPSLMPLTSQRNQPAASSQGYERTGTPPSAVTVLAHPLFWRTPCSGAIPVLAHSLFWPTPCSGPPPVLAHSLFWRTPCSGAPPVLAHSLFWRTEAYLKPSLLNRGLFCHLSLLNRGLFCHLSLSQPTLGSSKVRLKPNEAYLTQAYQHKISARSGCGARQTAPNLSQLAHQW